jgi:hypothetical protein
MTDAHSQQLPRRQLVRWPLLVVLTAVLAWVAVAGPRASRDREAFQVQSCRDKYAAAHTARDSAKVDVDVVPTDGHSMRYVSCASVLHRLTPQR